jgi:nucleolar GTP-binding protein
LQPLETLPEEDKALIEEMKKEAMGREMGEGAGDEGALMVMSTMNDEGVVAVKNAACERLLQVGVQGV